MTSSQNFIVNRTLNLQNALVHNQSKHLFPSPYNSFSDMESTLTSPCYLRHMPCFKHPGHKVFERLLH
uniref:Uncharacterized protein n=1 Tax=Megaselia scalaris TaxID=36166 RepID=T1GFP0_MEGSC